MAAKRERGHEGSAGAHRATSRRKKHSRPESLRPSSLVSCPDCGLLCLRHTGHDWDGQLFGIWQGQVDPIVGAIGLRTVLAQGLETRHGSHHCPPIAPRDLLSVCVADVGEVAAELGARVEKGGVWCGPS